MFCNIMITIINKSRLIGSLSVTVEVHYRLLSRMINVRHMAIVPAQDHVDSETVSRYGFIWDSPLIF